jgi:hypothetical protein
MGDRLAVVERLQHRELALVSLDQISEAPQQAASLRARHRRPRTALEGCPRACHGSVDVGALGDGDIPEHGTGGRVDGRERLLA